MLVIVYVNKFLLNTLFSCVKLQKSFEINRKNSQTISIFAYNFNATMETLVFTVALLGLAVVLLGVKIFFVKGGKFPNTHIHANPEMKKRGITCMRDKEFYE